MDLPGSFRIPLDEIIGALVRDEFDALEGDGRAGRLGAAGLRRAVGEYGNRLVELPEAAYDLIRAGVMPASANVWWVIVPLWTREEGRSDLALELTAIETPEDWGLEIDDLRVL